MIMGGSIESTFWRMVAAVVQHAAERELFVAGEVAATAINVDGGRSPVV
jgi:hypothetical protein